MIDDTARQNPRRFRSGRLGLPTGFLGAALGGVAALALVPAARKIAVHLLHAPTLPGAELAVGDLKGASFAEAAALLLGVPLAALFFGKLLPEFLDRRAPAARLSFEWIPLGLALWLPLWRRGLPLHAALPAGLALSALIAWGISRFRVSIRFRRVFVRRNRLGVFGLAFAGAAWDLARRAAPSNPVRLADDNLVEILACALLFLSLGLALMLLQGRRRKLTDVLARFTAAESISIGLSALAILFWRGAPILLSAGLLAFALVWLPRTVLPSRTAFGLAVVAFLCACAATIYYRPSGPVDLFEDGHSLGLTESYIRGAEPYRDTTPIHGWGYDGGVDGLLFRLTGPTLKAFRLRTAVTSALAVGSIALACLATFGLTAWSGIAVLLTLSLCPFVSGRHWLAFGSLALLASAVSARRRLVWFLAGAVASCELFFSLDMGGFVLAGGLGGALLLPMLEGASSGLARGIRAGSAFLCGALFGAAPFLTAFAAEGVLGNFLRTSFVEIPSYVSYTLFLPAGSAARAIREARTVGGLEQILAGDGMVAGFLLLLLAIVGTVLLFRAATRVFDRADGIAWIFFLVSCMAVRGVLGRSEIPHAALYGVFAGIPAAWLLRRTYRAGRARGLVLILLAVMWSRLHPLQTLDTELAATVGAAASRAQTAGMTVPTFRGGGAGVPPDQAAAFAALKLKLDEKLGPAGTFFDFSGEPALYFLTDRRMPIRYLAPVFYETQAAQAEVIGALEAREPRVAILSSGTWLDAPDGVSNRVRAPRVSAYLDAHYSPAGRVAGWTLAERKSPEAPRSAPPSPPGLRPSD